MRGQMLSSHTRSGKVISRAISRLIRDSLDAGIASESGLSLSLLFRSRGLFGMTTCVSFQGFRSEFFGEVVALHFQYSSLRHKSPVRSKVWVPETFLIADTKGEREMLIAGVIQTLYQELLIAKCKVTARVRDYESQTESSFTIRIRNDSMELQSVRSEARKLKWREELTGQPARGRFCG